MNVMTVLGSVQREALGVTLAHEHLLIDLRNQYAAPSDPELRRLGQQPLSPANVGEVRQNPYAIRDNLLLEDVELAGREIGEFRKLGGASVVDCTSLGIGRSAQSLREIARRTGLNIIAGCGYYTQDTHPTDMPHRPTEELAEEMVRDLMQASTAATSARASLARSERAGRSFRMRKRTFSPRPSRIGGPVRRCTSTRIPGAERAWRPQRSLRKQACRPNGSRSATSTWRFTWTTFASFWPWGYSWSSTISGRSSA